MDDSPDHIESTVGSTPLPPGDESAPVADAVSGQTVPPETPNPVKEATRRKPRVAKVKPENTKTDEPPMSKPTPMFFAGLNTTLAHIIRQERQEKIAGLSIV